MPLTLGSNRAGAARQLAGDDGGADKSGRSLATVWAVQVVTPPTVTLTCFQPNGSSKLP